MKTIRLTEHWAERDSGQGSVSNPSHQSNNNSTSNLHAQQLSNMMPASTSVSNSNLDRTAASAATAAIVLAGGCASVNNVTVNQVAIHQQQTPQIAQHHESGHDQFCNRKLPPESIRALLPFFIYVPISRPQICLRSLCQLHGSLGLFTKFSMPPSREHRLGNVGIETANREKENSHWQVQAAWVP